MSNSWKISDDFYATYYKIETADGVLIYKVGAYLHNRYAVTFQFGYERNAIAQYEAVMTAMAAMVVEMPDLSTAIFEDLRQHMPDVELRDEEGYLKVFPEAELAQASVEHVDDAMAAEKQRDAESGVDEVDEHEQ